MGLDQYAHLSNRKIDLEKMIDGDEEAKKTKRRFRLEKTRKTSNFYE